MRETGIDIIGRAPWGTHFCQFYETAQDLIDILVPYFAAGLAHNEFCMWITSEPLEVEQAKAALQEAVGDLEPYLRSGQLEILDYTQWYTAAGGFDADRVLQGWVAKLNVALEKGFDGLRLTGNTFWLEKSDWQDFAEYEAAVDGVIGQYRMLAVCTYSLLKCGAPEMLDVMANHAFALIKRDGAWQIIESAERKRAGEALRESEQRWATTLASIGDAVIATDPAGAVVFMNPVAERTTGWALAEAMGKPVEEVFHIVNERTRREVESPVARVLREGTVVGLANHTILVRKDGTDLPIDDSGAPIRDERGDVAGVVLVFRDITERKQAETYAAWLASFPEQNRMPVMEVEVSGRVYYANSAAREALPGLEEQGLRHPSLAGLPEVAAALTKGAPDQTRDVRVGDVWYQQTISSTSEGRLRIYAADITERRLAEDALRQARDELETRVSERTAELEQANDSLERENANRLRTEALLRMEGRRLDALLQLSEMHEAPLQEITAFTLEQAIALTESKIGFVGLLNEDESVYTIHAVSREVVKECRVAGDPLRWHVVDAGLWADAIRQRSSLFVNDYSHPHPSKKGLPPGHPYVGRLLVVPILDGARIVAVAGVGNKDSDYDRSDERQIRLLLGRMWDCVQRNLAGEELQRAYSELEHRVEQRTAELAAASAAQQKSLERLSRAESIAHLGSWELDVIENRLSWSDEVYHIFGLQPQEFKATYEAFLEAVYPDDRAAVDAAYTGSLREGKASYEIEHRVLRESGEIRWVHERCEHSADASGRIVRSAGMVLDITERRQAEQALLEAERARTRLAQALASEVGHRTKNNLAIVAGLLQMQMDEQSERISGPELIRDAITRIMSFAALHDQMYQSRSDIIELVDALRRISEASRQALSAGDLAITVQGEPVTYPSDVGTNLCVVANELITNAIKHSRPGNGVRRVEVQVSADNGELTLLVWNSDSEIGEGFDVVSKGRTGLGLVRTIVEDQYGGSFDLVPDREGTLARVVLDEWRLREAR